MQNPRVFAPVLCLFLGLQFLFFSLFIVNVPAYGF